MDELGFEREKGQQYTYQTHGFSILAGKRSETASSSDNGNSLARTSSRLLQSLVNGNTGAENWGDSLEVAFFGNARNVGGFGNAVLLECAVDCVAGEEGFGAERFV